MGTIAKQLTLFSGDLCDHVGAHIIIIRRGLRFECCPKCGLVLSVVRYRLGAFSR